MRFLTALVVSVAAIGWAAAQEIPTSSLEPVRIKIRHADPWAVKAMLEGQNIVSPEMSTLFAFVGMPPSTTQNINAFFTGGKLIVNPTDNSLWFIPDRK